MKPAAIPHPSLPSFSSIANIDGVAARAIAFQPEK
jgi:hypothetical protein